MSEEKGRVVGWGTCKWCGLEDQPIKATKKDHLYFICAPEADGGCNHQHFARGAVSDGHLAKMVTRWKSKEERAKWLTEAPAPEPEPEIDPEDNPPELEPENDPPPPQRRQPTKRRAPPPPPPKKKPAPPKRKGLFVWE
jgi:hypothetical protein